MRLRAPAVAWPLANRAGWLLGLLLLVAGCSPDAASGDGGTGDGGNSNTGPGHVDPFIGTGGNGFNVGSSYPGAVAPSGLAAPSPDTVGPRFGEARFLHCSGYWFGDDTIQGFSNLHMHGTGLPDYGVLALMPMTTFDAGRTTKSGYQAKYDKPSERAEPGYYAVNLAADKIQVELTATTRVALHRYTFAPGTSTGHVVIDLAHVLDEGKTTGGALTVTAAGRELRGHFRSIGDMSGPWGYPVNFVLRASAPWKQTRLWSEQQAEPAPGMAITGERVGAELELDVSAGKPITFALGLSLVSEEAAAAALDAEAPTLDFDAARASTASAWARVQQLARISGGRTDDQTKFLTALYHAFIMPTVMHDLDGSYVGFDMKVHRVEPGRRALSNLSLWDSYRTLHPLYSLLAPDLAADCARSLIEMGKQSGVFPKWPLADGDAGSMVGAGAEVVLADAYLKGITDFDARAAWAILRAAAMDPADPPAGRGGRGDVGPYMEYGYVPSTSDGKVSVTLELSQDDFALGNLAAALGEKADAEALLARRLGYRKLFDPVTGFLRGRLPSGAFARSSFDPVTSQSDYVEANGWQSLWVPHDVDGMITLFGSRAALVARLEQMFEQTRSEWESIGDGDVGRRAAPRPYYWAGNEPDIHAVYLFAQAGRPDLTQKWVKWLMHSFYGTGADGLPGNDDGGTMSAWYIFSALGLYPLVGSDRYTVGAPLFPHAEIAVKGGSFTIDATGPGGTTLSIDSLSGDSLFGGSLYVQAVTLNGAPLDRAELRHADLRAGGSLKFEMGSQPSRWGRVE